MGDDRDDWTLDEEFVRGGRHEPPARTRDAIARLGSQQTSWRQHGLPDGADETRRGAGTVEHSLGKGINGTGVSPRLRNAGRWVFAIFAIAVAAVTCLQWLGTGRVDMGARSAKPDQRPLPRPSMAEARTLTQRAGATPTRARSTASRPRRRSDPASSLQTLRRTTASPTR